VDPVAAGQWRIAVREAFVAAFADGFRVIGVSPIGNYVLERLA
jgi:predicted GNAT superfamily acetyltransferase